VAAKFLNKFVLLPLQSQIKIVLHEYWDKVLFSYIQEACKIKNKRLDCLPRIVSITGAEDKAI
jgi:hypothetical protein